MNEKLNSEILLSGIKKLYRQGELNLRIGEAFQRLAEELRRSGAKETDQFSIELFIDGQGNLACKAIKE